MPNLNKFLQILTGKQENERVKVCRYLKIERISKMFRLFSNSSSDSKYQETKDYDLVHHSSCGLGGLQIQ